MTLLASLKLKLCFEMNSHSLIHSMSCIWIVTELLCLFGSALCQELRYALFTAGPSGRFDSSGVVPAIELAEEMINADSYILPGYNLTHTTVYDTKVHEQRHQ